MKLAFAAAGALIALSAPSLAQETAAAPAAEGSERVNQLIVYGDDPCPQSTNDQINVCARKPESERYRIPEALRGNPNDPANQAWATKATELQYVGRSGIGSCSPVGAGGMIGCYNDLVRQARAERAGRDEVNWNRLIEEARQERLGRIDAEAAAVEADQAPPR
ncbi:hypothetical protein [Allosphingosinicella deserti]|uniref:Uncharacterized protein n=1 Tax=Allosphingosinicella deserti TaxID=2116704 RepID=A0A2P7QZJ2_9SPHN|nr:hypothetical protein [Sphingomonas deserti]PSJ43376.1 hypothetical protein C7I55_03155 [Sphingomonas deserti]